MFPCSLTLLLRWSIIKSTLAQRLWQWKSGADPGFEKGGGAGGSGRVFRHI